MLEEHLTCPKCGYDLHGIPESRCPECGFGYDAAALRSMADSAEWGRRTAARMVIVRASAAIAMATPVVSEQLGAAGLGRFVVVATIYAGAFLVWTIFTDAYQGSASIPNLLTLFIGIGLGFGYMFRYISGVAIVGSVIALALAWLVLVRDWPVLPPPGNTKSSGLRRSAVRYSVGSVALLVVATLLVLCGFALS